MFCAETVVENAIHYGANAEGEIHITTRIAAADGNLHIRIEDAGTGMEAETLKHLRWMMERGENSSIHTGIYNIHRRIQLLYGMEYGIEITRRAEGGTCVAMLLPMDDGEGGVCDAARAHR